MNRFPFDTTVPITTQLIGEAAIPQTRISRRDLVKGGAIATVATLTLGAKGCPAKNLSAWVASIVSGFSEIKPLLAQLGLSQSAIDRVSGFIDRAVSIAREFDKAYQAGAFANAATLFASLSGLITSIAAELNVSDNRIVKLALISIAIARIAIASLLKSQAEAQGVSGAGLAANPAAMEIQRLAAVDVNALLKAVQ